MNPKEATQSVVLTEAGFTRPQQPKGSVKNVLNQLIDCYKHKLTAPSPSPLIARAGLPGAPAHASQIHAPFILSERATHGLMMPQVVPSLTQHHPRLLAPSSNLMQYGAHLTSSGLGLGLAQSRTLQAPFIQNYTPETDPQYIIQVLQQKLAKAEETIE